MFAQVLTATYATSVVPGVNAGASFEIYQFRQDCQGVCEKVPPATTEGLDVGLQYLPRQLRTLQLGASVLHLGFPFQVVNHAQSSPTPVRVRVGGAYEIGHHFLADTTVAAWISTDFVTSPRGQGSQINVGAELSLQQTIFLRGGYAGGSGINSGAAAGVGLRYDRFELDVAKSFVSTAIDETEPIRITFGIHF